MTWARKDMSRWNNQSQNSEERIVINRQRSYQKGLFMFGAFGNFAIYNAFLTGIYNYRYYELLNMRRVPFVLKFAISSTLSGLMCYTMYNDNLYDETLYKIALKYRHEFDEEYKTKIEEENVEFLA